jgi:molybdopterin molybdotransferase
VTIGGASVGDFDLVQSTALARGLDLDFYKIAMRPGKPLMAGRLRGVPLVGLPGNPVSAMVCGLLFLRPAVDAMLGLPGELPAPMPARLGAEVEANGPRAHYLRARVAVEGTGWRCTPFPRQDSSLLSVLAEANGLMVRPPGDPSRTTGEAVEFIWF